MRRFSTAVTITDPLVKYKSLVSTGIYAPATAQHRLAHHLQKVYLRIKDYTPQTEYRERLNQVARLTEKKIPEEEEDGRGVLALKHHSIWRNPLFKHLLSTPEGRESLALTRVLSSYQTAIEIDSPKGLFLSGEVGTGKSMLLDLLADGLPTERKRRWHFNTFMLYAFSQLETHRRSQPYDAALRKSVEADYSLLWLAKKLVDESPILFLDEFQLPDRAASKILSHLFIAFFQLGGVLIASSNRMPEELQKATGLDYAPAPAKGLIRRMFGTAGLAQKGELFGQSSDFANFLEVLKARCDFWQMEGATDWRRREEVEVDEIDQETTGGDGMAIGGLNPSGEQEKSNKDVAKRPRHYLLPADEPNDWIQRVKAAASWTGRGPVPWEPVDLVVYGRKVHTPQSYQGCVYWDFAKLVESFGPADYITMASSYHTFIIDNIPVLTLSMKNEARRFITLLDALYEARCKLLIRANSTPDHLFFPSKKTTSSSLQASNGDDDATYSETIAEVYQDQMAPFRPNVSFYDTANPTSTYDPDQDSDFGLQQQLQRPQPAIDFGNTGAFTGEDERFAYKRGVSRLWELCSAQWHARTGDWWRPLPIEARHWEGGEASKRVEWKPGFGASADSGEGMGESVDIEEPAGLSKWRIEWLKKKEE